MDDNLDELKQHHDTLIAKLQDVSDRDYKTKTELVKELIDVSRPLVKSGLINGIKLKDLATYINAKLIENGITNCSVIEFGNSFNFSELCLNFG